MSRFTSKSLSSTTKANAFSTSSYAGHQSMHADGPCLQLARSVSPGQPVPGTPGSLQPTHRTLVLWQANTETRRGIDIVKLAKKANKAYFFKLKSVPTGPDGLMTISFEPITSFPLIAGIEVAATDGSPVELLYVDGTIRYNVGGGKLTDDEGNAWISDVSIVGGQNEEVEADPLTSVVRNAPPGLRPVYNTGRSSASSLLFLVNVAKGTYTVRLLFNEFLGARSKDRKIQVIINSRTLAEKWDTANQVGESTAGVLEDVFTVTGIIFISLNSVKGDVLLSGIEILKGDQRGTARVGEGLESITTTTVAASTTKKPTTTTTTTTTTSSKITSSATAQKTTTSPPSTEPVSTSSSVGFADFNVYVNCGAKKALEDRKGNRWVTHDGFVKNRAVRTKRTRKKTKGPNPSAM